MMKNMAPCACGSTKEENQCCGPCTCGSGKAGKECCHKPEAAASQAPVEQTPAQPEAKTSESAPTPVEKPLQ
ncbi:MAG: hypothetical protein Q8P02_04015 [Candidatus Micrarchaeota archaeon]|nr:hypothetical protein [Candidatus Micrarchaeota archaeon]